MHIKLNSESIESQQLQDICEILKEGGIIVYPTETAYGIGCDALNEKAVAKIYKIKKRPRNQPLPVIVDSLEAAEKIAAINEQIAKLSKAFHPGPLVIATQKKMILPDIVNQKGVAFRISSNKIVQQITKQTQRPLISTSANIAGGKTPYSIEQVFEQLSKKDIDVILDAGTLVKQKPSTIIDFQMSPHPQLIRQGEITAEQIFNILRIPKKDWEKHKQAQI